MSGMIRRSTALLIPIVTWFGLVASCSQKKEVPKTTGGVHRVLFLGNSITKHAPAPELGWTGNWGMAASAEELDYTHLVIKGLTDWLGKKPEVMITNIADFERSPSTYDIEKHLATELAFKPTLVIVAIGENVEKPRSAESKERFESDLTRLINAVKKAGDPLIVVRSSFWADTAKDRILEQVCSSFGGLFVDLRALAKDPSNFANAEKTIENKDVAVHPGDKGMKSIANAILGSITTSGKYTSRD